LHLVGILFPHINHVVFVMDMECAILEVATVVVLWVLVFWTHNSIVVPQRIWMFHMKIVTSFSRVAKFETY